MEPEINHHHPEHDRPDFDLDFLGSSEIGDLLEACRELKFENVEDELFQTLTEYMSSHPEWAVSVVEELSVATFVSSRLFAAMDVRALYEASPCRMAAVAKRLLLDPDDEVVSQALTSVQMIEQARLLDLQTFAGLHQALVAAQRRVHR
ncbi:hypothetical protein [Arthrobacter sp. HLT1-20]